MGVNTSKELSESVLRNVFDAKLYNKCPVVAVELDQEVGNISVKDCDANIMIKQESYIEDDCALNTTIKNLTDFYMKKQQDISKGLIPNIVNVSKITTRDKVYNEIRNEIYNICTEVKVNQKQLVRNVACEGGKLNLPILQKFYGKTSCVVNELISRVDKWESSQNQKVDQSSGFLTGVKYWFIMQIIAVVLIIAVLLAFIWFLTTPSGEKLVEQGSNVAKVVALL